MLIPIWVRLWGGRRSGPIVVDHNSIPSILAHELAHTMYGPEAVDGTPGCRLPEWSSEAHAGWIQRQVGREMGFGEKWPYAAARDGTGGYGPAQAWTWPSKRRIVRSDRAEMWSLCVTMTIVRPPPELGHCDLPVMGVDDTV
jgi:hypothetical protein